MEYKYEYHRVEWMRERIEVKRLDLHLKLSREVEVESGGGAGEDHRYGPRLLFSPSRVG